MSAPPLILGEHSVHISSSFVSTPQLARQSFRACHPRVLAFRLLLAVLCVLLGLVLLAEALLGPQQDSFGVVLGCVMLLLGIGWPVLQRRQVTRRLRDYAEPATTRIVLTDTEYTVEGPGPTLTRLWSTFKSVRLVHGFWVLKTASEGALAFPSSALDATPTETFRTAMGDKGLLVR